MRRRFVLTARGTECFSLNMPGQQTGTLDHAIVHIGNIIEIPFHPFFPLYKVTVAGQQILRIQHCQPVYAFLQKLATAAGKVRPSHPGLKNDIPCNERLAVR